MRAGLALPADLDELLLPWGHPGSQPQCLSFEQSEEDIDVTALGKRQPENISNPMYESATSAPPEPSYDPFTVSVLSYLGTGPIGVQGRMSRSKSQGTASHQEKLTSRTLSRGSKPTGSRGAGSAG